MASWLDADFDPDDAAARAQMMSALGENVGAIEIDALTPPAAATEPHHGLATNHSLHSGPPFLRASVPWGAQLLREVSPDHSALAASRKALKRSTRGASSVCGRVGHRDGHGDAAVRAALDRVAALQGGRPPRCISPSTWAKRPLARSLWPNSYLEMRRGTCTCARRCARQYDWTASSRRRRRRARRAPPRCSRRLLVGARRWWRCRRAGWASSSSS